MEKAVSEKSFELEAHYWWYAGRRAVARSVLGGFLPGRTRKIADIGCGTGGNFSLLSEFGQVVGLDIDAEALRFCRQKGLGDVRPMADEYHTGLPDSSQDLTTLFDVLEHFADDSAAIAELKRISAPGGFVLITAPAFAFLWSEVDAALHHHRRYTRPELRRKIEAQGLRVVKISYIFFFVFPLIAFTRVVGKLNEKSLHPQFNAVQTAGPLNSLLLLLSRIEGFLIRFMDLPFGSSVMILAQRPR